MLVKVFGIFAVQWELDKHSNVRLELRASNEMTQSTPPVEQMVANGAGHCQKVEMVTTKKENVAVLSDSFMSQCSMTSSGMFYFLGQTQTETEIYSISAKLCFVVISKDANFEIIQNQCFELNLTKANQTVLIETII